MGRDYARLQNSSRVVGALLNTEQFHPGRRNHARRTVASDLDPVGEASDGREAVTLARAELPDVLLMDIRMPAMDGIEATRCIVDDPATAGVRLLIPTTFDVDELVYEALAAGASGFLLKDAAPEQLLHAIRVVASGEALLAPSVTSRLGRQLVRGPAPGAPSTDVLAPLTERDRGPVARRRGIVQPRDRRTPHAQPSDGEDARQPDPHQARPAGPGAARCAGL